MSENTTIRMTNQRQRVLELMKEHGPLSARGVQKVDPELFPSRQSARNAFVLGAEAGLWMECPGAPGVYQLHPTVSTQGSIT